MKKIFHKELILNILIPLVLGAIIGFISKPSSYGSLSKPPLSPPGIVFPIVWSILYILMGIGNYLTNNEVKSYKIQLLVNLVWPLIFFNFKMYFLAFVWLLLLIFLVIKMLIEFYRINKLAAYFNIPYLLWILFAFYLNFGVFLLN